MPDPAATPSQPEHDAARALRSLVETLDILWAHPPVHTAGTTASTAQLRIMTLIDGRPGIRMRILAHTLDTTAPSLTRMCDRLENLGFLERRTSPHDARERTLRLSPAGSTHLAHVRNQREATLTHALTAMPPDSRRALSTGLAALHHSITRL
ncbi:MarR family winged helix-turn-helix transcriptional regulator [Streptomyces sp. NPDC048507]|uniref:MarR family winged helix-turn-helix transcriptional regulator n=1 Tax=Streptomyces sp. NPDC048507 TaxID=3365560 RepID=UPI003724593F